MTKVSVVVPVYNPGENIDDLLDSLDQQTMPAGEFEVIFVDDDSTDGTRERLQEWAVRRPHVRVIRNTPNSGWPGKPRNMAIDAANGEFLFFADNDDMFAPGSLQAMYDYALETGADVVIGKEAGVGRAIPRELFRENIPDAVLGRDPILTILTPHKFVRTEMVRSNGIRFPEGKVRLEDHLFIIPCYFAAKRIAVLSDQVCYYYRRRVGEGQNESAKLFDPIVYYGAMEHVLEIVEANVEPGPLRDELYARWYDGKIVRRVGRWLAIRSPEYQERFLGEVHRFCDRFELGEAHWPYMGVGARMRSYLLHHASLTELKALAPVEHGITQQITLEDVQWDDQSRLQIDFHSRLTYADGTPVTIRREGTAAYWDVEDRVPDLDVPKLDVSDLDLRPRLEVLSIDRETRDARYVPGSWTPIEGESLAATARVVFDPRQRIAAHQGAAICDLRSRLTAAGWGGERRIPVPRHLNLPEPRVVDGALVRPYVTRGGQFLALDIHAAEVSEPDGEGSSTTSTKRHSPEAGEKARVDGTTSALSGASIPTKSALRSTLGRVKRKAQSIVSR